MHVHVHVLSFFHSVTSRHSLLPVHRAVVTLSNVYNSQYSGICKLQYTLKQVPQGEQEKIELAKMFYDVRNIIIVYSIII